MLLFGERIEGTFWTVVVNGVEYGTSKSGKNDCKEEGEDRVRPRRQKSCPTNKPQPGKKTISMNKPRESLKGNNGENETAVCRARQS